MKAKYRPPTWNAFGCQVSGDCSAGLSANQQQIDHDKLETTLRECKWNKAAAAERLGISYKTLLTRIKSHGLD